LIYRDERSTLWDMGKINYRTLSKKEYEKLGREFWNTCNKAGSVKELTKFIDSFLLPSERVMITRRILAAKQFEKKRLQTDIQDELQIGQSTVDTVQRVLDTLGPGERRILKG